MTLHLRLFSFTGTGLVTSVEPHGLDSSKVLQATCYSAKGWKQNAGFLELKIYAFKLKK